MSCFSVMVVATALVASSCTGLVGSAQSEGESASGNAGAGGSRTGGTDRPSELASETLAPAPLRMSRLSRDEYENTISDVFGVHPSRAAVVHLDRDLATLGSLALGAREVAVSRGGVEGYAKAAEGIAGRALADADWRKMYMVCQPANATDVLCAQSFVAKAGRRLFRRALSDAEIKRYVAVVTRVGDKTQSFEKGVEAALCAFLLSPKFTHRIEAGGSNGQLTGLELAAKLSFLLWDTAPDELLLAEAEAGQLDDAAGLRKIAARLLSDKTRLANGVRAIFDDVFALQKVQTVAKDSVRFPEDSPALRNAMRESTLRMIVHVVLTQGARLRDVYETDTAFANNLIAPFYDQPGTATEFWQIAKTAKGARVGLLTEPSILTAHAGVSLTSPTFRGKFIQESLLCSEVPAPPANVNNNLPANAEGRTRRQQISSHMDNDSCRSCHMVMDPLGFGLERFDALGRVQANDNGEPIDDSGVLDGKTFVGAREMSRLVRDDPNSARCLLSHVVMHVLGRSLGHQDDAAIDRLAKQLQAANENLVPLLEHLVSDDSFRLIGPEGPPSN